jgi:hypothetical protein
VRRRPGGWRIGGLVAALAWLGGPGCAEPGWDLERLESRHPQLRARAAHRLGDVTPYYLPLAARLTLFLCRWPDAATVPVSLPLDASADERRKIEAALAAWEGALGLRFERAFPSGVGIEIRLFDEMLAYSANTVADCAVDAQALGSGAPDALPARLVKASIHLAHGDPRLTGSALHELGHALGFQGHASQGRTVMVKATEAIRLAGERVLAGKPFGDDTLAALCRWRARTPLSSTGCWRSRRSAS